MTHRELEECIGERLNHLTERILQCLEVGDRETAALLQDSCNQLCDSADTESYNFLYIPVDFGSEVE